MVHRSLGRSLLAALVLAAAAAIPAGATTLMRAGLGDLVAGNEVIVSGEVLDVNSHWNAEGSFILTDVRVAVADFLKGDNGQRVVTFTILGGTVGDLTSLIVGGPEVEAGNTYLFFLNHEDLPGVASALTVRDLCQGAFNVVDTPTGRRAVSQAAGEALVPDATGSTDVVGGADGLPLDLMTREVRRLASAR